VSPSCPMADDGAPRGTPPPRPSSRSGGDHSTPPRDDPDPAAPAAADADREAERRHLRRATTLDAHRDPPDPRDAELDHLRRVLADYREENDSLGEAVLAMKSTLLRASAEAERAASERSAAALASARDALASSRAEVERLRASLEETEQLALELTDDLEAMKRAKSAETSAREDAEATATTAEEETAAARAMADELRDAVTRLERDAAAREARDGARDAIETALAEARAAAESATKDRDVLAANWRREWEAAKEDHAAELRSVRARVAALEADAAEARKRVDAERDAKRALERELAESRERERASRRDQDGAAQSLRLMVEHEDATRESTRRREETTRRLREDAAQSAARCEHVAAHCAALLAERDTVVRRAEAAEAAEAHHRAEARAAGSAAAAAAAAAASAASASPSASTSPSSRDDASPPAADSVPSLLRAAVRVGKRSPDSFAAGMRPRARVVVGAARSPAPDPSTPRTPPAAAGGWIGDVGEDVAEELVRALAREVADSRENAERYLDEATEARRERDDARRELLTETRRVRELERMRVADLRELHAAEQRARAATNAAWGLRDRLAVALAEKHVVRWEEEEREKTEEKATERGKVAREERFEERGAAAKEAKEAKEAKDVLRPVAETRANILAARVEADIAETADRPAVVAVAVAKSAPTASLWARSPPGRDALPEDLKPLTPGRSPPGPSDVRASVREPPPPRLTSFSPL
jgi:hypothetical protein